MQQPINLKTEIVNGEIVLTLNARLEDWETLKLIIESALDGYKKK